MDTQMLLREMNFVCSQYFKIHLNVLHTQECMYVPPYNFESILLWSCLYVVSDLFEFKKRDEISFFAFSKKFTYFCLFFFFNSIPSLGCILYVFIRTYKQNLEKALFLFIFSYYKHIRVYKQSTIVCLSVLFVSVLIGFILSEKFNCVQLRKLN